MSWPRWLTDSGRLTHKVVTWPAISLAQDRESSPARTSGLTTMLRHQHGLGLKTQSFKTKTKTLNFKYKTETQRFKTETEALELQDQDQESLSFKNNIETQRFKTKIETSFKTKTKTENKILRCLEISTQVSRTPSLDAHRLTQNKGLLTGTVPFEIHKYS